MKTFKELREALTTQQRIKRSISSKKVAKKAALKRKRSMKKPPTQEKVMKAVKRAVRQKALAIVDKAGVYKTASVGVKMGIEKKADLKIKKIGAKWEKRLKPEVKKAMKAAYKSRMGKSNPES
jgi:galactose-1-phosphate uridylyltransferase